METTYVRLLVGIQYDTVFRMDERVQYVYLWKSGWIRSGILVKYQNPFDDLRDEFEEISEEEAMRIVNRIDKMTPQDYMFDIRNRFRGEINRNEDDSKFMDAENKRITELISDDWISYQEFLFAMKDGMEVPNNIHLIKNLK